MDGRKRTVQIKFRVTEAERDLILEKMKLVPTRNMAAYLRKIAIDGYIIQIDHADIKAMTAEIQKIGVNVNQIARRVNAAGNAYQEDIEEIKGVLAEIWRLQRLSLLKAPYLRKFFEYIRLYNQSVPVCSILSVRKIQMSVQAVHLHFFLSSRPHSITAVSEM